MQKLVHVLTQCVIVKAAVCKFCLFVAISVWKPGIAAFLELSSVRGVVSRHGSSADESNVLRWMCSSQSRTGVDVYCTSQSQILAYVLEYITQIRIFTVYCHLNK